jgi:hypothetical protein
MNNKEKIEINMEDIPIGTPIYLGNKICGRIVSLKLEKRTKYFDILEIDSSTIKHATIELELFIAEKKKNIFRRIFDKIRIIIKKKE